ncbi:MAG: hypothetical protein WKF90_16570 [Pyrinomonadaceae bacterium]
MLYSSKPFIISHIIDIIGLKKSILPYFIGFYLRFGILSCCKNNTVSLRSFLALSKSASRTIIFIDVRSFKTYSVIKVSKAALDLAFETEQKAAATCLRLVELKAVSGTTRRSRVPNLFNYAD